MTYRIEGSSIEKSVTVSAYRKKIGGFPSAKNLRNYTTVASWTGAMRKKHGDKMPIAAHTRGNPAPTKQELAQKKMNNKLAAEGSSKRVFINDKGHAKIVSKDKEKNLMFKRKWGKKNLHSTRASKDFGVARKKD